MMSKTGRVLRTGLRACLPERVARYAKEVLRDVYAIRSYSQEGEDMVLRRLLEGTREGFYVDVGAHHPRRFSNTHHFYLKGWRGINIDARPGAMGLFHRLRPRDINLEVAVAADEAQIEYLLFDEPAINGVVNTIARARMGPGARYRVLDRVLVRARPLRHILEEHLPSNVEISFLSIDVEGGEQGVLESNDWKQYRPRYVVVEILDTRLTEIAGHPITTFLTRKGYEPECKCVHSVIFRNVLRS